MKVLRSISRTSNSSSTCHLRTRTDGASAGVPPALVHPQVQAHLVPRIVKQNDDAPTRLVDLVDESSREYVAMYEMMCAIEPAALRTMLGYLTNTMFKRSWNLGRGQGLNGEDDRGTKNFTLHKFLARQAVRALPLPRDQVDLAALYVRRRLAQIDVGRAGRARRRALDAVGRARHLALDAGGGVGTAEASRSRRGAGRRARPSCIAARS